MDACHARYCKALQALYDAHKDRQGRPPTRLWLNQTLLRRRVKSYGASADLTS